MKIIQILTLILTTTTFSQNYIGINQSNFVIHQSNVNYSSNNFGLSMIANEISAFRNSWENRKKREEAIYKAKSQLEIVKSTYENSSSYPEIIVDGWHSVMATDNYNYCSVAKVLIKDNQISEFVLGNWEKLSRPFELLTPINKGKALITLDFDGKTDTMELYFISDLTKPTIVEKPLKSGYISFWSDLGRARSIKIWFEKKYFGELGKVYESEPECGSDGTITIEVKPGTYYFKGAGRGTISWEGKVEAQENLCLSYVLNKKNYY
ncbi:hypothetical protein AB832_05405 [Flavobacteriaceae bacterium (ex Bugula neritina AB1)]|nr:hypothetical protein AB832_05405 [Flavobacteriaceae bacterium (ex Bugula neritina AB1)]